MLSNNKFLGKCWYGGHPWIGQPWKVKVMVEKGINFIFCLGTAYVSSMESVGMLQVIFVGRKSMPLKNNFISQFNLWALAPLQIPTSLREGPFFYLCNFYFECESLSSIIKHKQRGTIIVFEHWVQLIFECVSLMDQSLSIMGQG